MLKTLKRLGAVFLLSAAGLVSVPQGSAFAQTEIVATINLGATFGDNPGGLGAVVQSVTPGKAFAVVGIQVGDIIVAVNDVTVIDSAHAYALFGLSAPGAKYLLRVRDVNTGTYLNIWLTII